MNNALKATVAVLVVGVVAVIAIKTRTQAAVQLRSGQGVVVKAVDFEDAAGKNILSYRNPLDLKDGRIGFVDFPGSTTKTSVRIKVTISDPQGDRIASCEMQIRHRICIGEAFVVADRLNCSPCVSD